ncbi:MAG TPA: DUF309 domain-containing protein [Bacteroidota bacterium]|nr:DUF309 domain-containing protein [Bacteroidota bacterium]
MDGRFWTGISEFNAGRFFEEHEVLEDLWHEYRETDRTFLQGLIQLSAGFYHAQCRNLRGAESQLSKAIAKLEVYGPLHASVQLSGLLRDAREYLLEVQNGLKSSSGNWERSPFPRIQSMAIE